MSKRRTHQEQIAVINELPFRSHSAMDLHTVRLFEKVALDALVSSKTFGV